MFWKLLLIALGLGILYFRFRKRRIYKVYREIPSGFMSYPLVGHSYLLTGNDEDRMDFFQRLGRTSINQGGLTSIWLANKLYVVMSDPGPAEVIYETCLDKDETVLRFTRALIGNGSIYAPVSIWRPRRKILAPVFNMKNLNQSVEVFAAQSIVMTRLLNQQVGAGDFTIWKYLTTYTFDSVCETTMGVKLNAQGQPDHPFLHAFDRVAEIITERIAKPWLHPDFMFKLQPFYEEFVRERRVLYDFVDELIENKRKEMATRNAQYQPKIDDTKCFLEMIIEQSGGTKGYTNLELREEVLVLLIAGTDTSAIGASYVVVLLSKYPDVQEKVFQELLDVFGNSDRPVKVEDLPRLKYLEAVLKETLRLYPPVPLILREVHGDVKLPSADDLSIQIRQLTCWFPSQVTLELSSDEISVTHNLSPSPKMVIFPIASGTTLVDGVSIILHTWAMHRNPKYWGEDAEEFRPERFLESLWNPMQFQPFSYSNRNCLGSNYAMMSMKTVLANLLRRYKLLPPSNVDSSKLKEPLRVKHAIMMKHADGYYVRLGKRCYGANH